MIQLNKIYKFLLGLVFLAFLNSCSEEAPIESNITNYATFEVIGGQYTMVEAGTTYNDPGVIAKAGETELPVTISGSVDATEIGLYIINYSATNLDGYSSSISRYVIVTDNPAYIESTDLSGEYIQSTNAARTMTLTKISDGFYQANDFVPPNNISGLIVQVSEIQLIIPAQPSPFGEIVADPTVNAATSATLVDGSDISLALNVGSFGIFNRTFLKD